VAEQHRRFWEPLLSSRDSANIVVQPENRGTANGMLLPLLHIIARDPDARIVLLPSDHHVRDEAVLAECLQKAVARLDHVRDEIILLGMEPDELDPELGYIVPGVSCGYGLREVSSFAEKPSETRARELMIEGALWNVFILAVRARTLLQVFERAMPSVVASMKAAVAREMAASSVNAVQQLYRTLPAVDFSRDVAQKNASVLRVIAVPPCGWSDLGTPKRVGQALLRVSSRNRTEARSTWSAHLNLAIQHARMSGAGAVAAH
jgi:mannose-1-phosphate guanylyltransferase